MADGSWLIADRRNRMARFSFEDLEVWKRAVLFAEMVILSSEQWKTAGKHFRLLEQVESTSASVAMNIAEGKGRFSKKEFVYYLHIARGSLFEVVTLLTIVAKLEWIDDNDFEKLRNEAEIIGKMLSSLINSIKNSQIAIG